MRGITQKSAAPARRPLDCLVMPATTTEKRNEHILKRHWPRRRGRRGLGQLGAHRRRTPGRESRSAGQDRPRDWTAWRINSSLEVWFPLTAEELVKLRQDKDRLEWILPIVTGVDSDNADWKAMAIAAALMAGLDGRAAIDRAMKSA